MDGLQIFSIIIGTAGVIGSFIVLATHIINRRIDDVNKRIDDTNKRIDSLENSLVRRIEKIEEDNKEIRKELANIKLEMAEMKGDMKEMKVRMDSMEKRMERIESDGRDIKNLLYKIIDISQNQQKKNKDNSENRIFSIANKNFKTSFSIPPLSEPLEFSSREKRKKQKSERIVDNANKCQFFQKKLLKNNKTQKL
jgi:chromosome segregation ATPase